MKIRVIERCNRYYVQHYNNIRGWKNVLGSLGTLLVYDNEKDAINNAKSLAQYYNESKVVWSSDETN